MNKYQLLDTLRLMNNHVRALGQQMQIAEANWISVGGERIQSLYSLIEFKDAFYAWFESDDDIEFVIIHNGIYVASKRSFNELVGTIIISEGDN
jgi:hypothetical protein